MLYLILQVRKYRPQVFPCLNFKEDDRMAQVLHRILGVQEKPTESVNWCTWQLSRSWWGFSDSTKGLLAALLLAQMLCVFSCAEENVVSSWWLSRGLWIVCELLKIFKRKERWVLVLVTEFMTLDVLVLQSRLWSLLRCLVGKGFVTADGSHGAVH